MLPEDEKRIRRGSNSNSLLSHNGSVRGKVPAEVPSLRHRRVPCDDSPAAITFRIARPCQVPRRAMVWHGKGQSEEERTWVPEAVPSVCQRIPSSSLPLLGTVEKSSR